MNGLVAVLLFVGACALVFGLIQAVGGSQDEAGGHGHGHGGHH